MPVGIFDSISEGLARALTVHYRRHEVLAANVANVETPGYRAQDLDFADALAAAFESTAAEESDAAPSEPRTIDRPSGTMRPDGNTVDIDMEMTRLADNRGAYAKAAEILARRLAGLRRAIESTA
jgi:flagellar basal-body rod protein FlgB